MERRLPFIAAFFLILTGSQLFLSGQKSTLYKEINIQLRTNLDAYPEYIPDTGTMNTAVEKSNISGIKTQEELKQEIFGTAITRMKELAPFLLEGMIYGWTFEYTPYDKARKVAEYFSFEPVRPHDNQLNKIEYRSPKVIDNQLTCWVYTARTPEQMFYYEQWQSVKIPHIHGTGAEIMDESFDSMKKAVENAVKQAVRDYFRTQIKTKPKEIRGKVLLDGEPLIFVSDGRYKADLDFFMETDRIITYTSF